MQNNLKKNPAKNGKDVKKGNPGMDMLGEVFKLPEEKKYYDIEELLISSLITNSHSTSHDNILIWDLIYSMSKSMEEVGYTYGHAVGRDIFYKTDGRLDVLIRILEKIGIGRPYYYPSKDMLLIRSTSKPHHPPVGKTVHSYEAGIISGFFSSYAGLDITTTELRCIYNGDKNCEFVTELNPEPIVGKPTDHRKLIDALVTKIMDLDYSTVNGMKQDYHMLPILPLLKRPLLDEISRLLYALGRKLAQKTGKKDIDSTIKNVAYFFGISKAFVENAGRGERVIKLRYSTYNSTHEFVVLSTSMLLGFAKEKFGGDGTIYKRLARDRSYLLTIQIK